MLLGNDVESVGYASDQAHAAALRSVRAEKAEPAQIVHLQEWQQRTRDDSEHGD
jgi:hypothetical protein